MQERPHIMAPISSLSSRLSRSHSPDELWCTLSRLVKWEVGDWQELRLYVEQGPRTEKEGWRCRKSMVKKVSQGLGSIPWGDVAIWSVIKLGLSPDYKVIPPEQGCVPDISALPAKSLGQHLCTKYSNDWWQRTKPLQYFWAPWWSV